MIQRSSIQSYQVFVQRKKGPAEPSSQCSVEVNESSGVPMAMTEQLEEDKDIFNKLKIPWMP